MNPAFTTWEQMSRPFASLACSRNQSMSLSATKRIERLARGDDFLLGVGVACGGPGGKRGHEKGEAQEKSSPDLDYA